MFEADPKTDQMGKEIHPFVMGYLPDFYQRKAEVELKDTPENRQKGLKILKDFMEKDKHFNGMSFDEDFLLQYLRCRKFNAKRAFTQLKAFVNLRQSHKFLFNDLHFENIAISTKNKIVTYLPYRCQDGCAILLVKLDNWIPEDFPPEEVKRMVTLFVLQALRDPMTQVNGFKVILDVESNPMRHLRYATPSNMYLMYHGTQSSEIAGIPDERIPVLDLNADHPSCEELLSNNIKSSEIVGIPGERIPALDLNADHPSCEELLSNTIKECSPGRFKGIHIVNTSLTFKAAWAVVKIFLSTKLKRRIHFHATPEGLLDYFPAAVLPVEYGGELKDYDMTDWLKDVMSPEKLATLGGGKYSAS